MSTSIGERKGQGEGEYETKYYNEIDILEDLLSCLLCI